MARSPPHRRWHHHRVGSSRLRTSALLDSCPRCTDRRRHYRPAFRPYRPRTHCRSVWRPFGYTARTRSSGRRCPPRSGYRTYRRSRRPYTPGWWCRYRSDTQSHRSLPSHTRHTSHRCTPRRRDSFRPCRHTRCRRRPVSRRRTAHTRDRTRSRSRRARSCCQCIGYRWGTRALRHIGRRPSHRRCRTAPGQRSPSSPNHSADRSRMGSSHRRRTRRQHRSPLPRRNRRRRLARSQESRSRRVFRRPKGPGRRL